MLKTIETSFTKLALIVSITKANDFQIDTSQPCQHVANNSEAGEKEMAPASLISKMKENFEAYDSDIKWQYYATEKGMMTLYPAAVGSSDEKCQFYDPRFRLREVL